MVVLRPLIGLILCLLPARGATFGTVVSNPQGQSGISDIVLDEAPRRIYLVNTSLRRIDVYGINTNPPRLTSSVIVDATPLSAAISRNGKSLYVTCQDASALNVIDLDTLTKKPSV